MTSAPPATEASTSSSSGPATGLRVAIVALALAAAAIAAGLFYMKLTGRITSIVGCGGPQGCGSLLGGKWSSSFGIPVTLPALALYVAIAMLALVPLVVPSARARATGWLLALGLLAGLAGLWFFGIQALVARAFCPWCSTIHGLMILAAVVAVFVWRRSGTPAPVGPLGLAAAAFAAFALGQVFGPAPATAEIVEGLAPAGAPGAAEAAGTNTAESPASPPPGSGRVISFGGGQLEVELGTVPILGPPDAEHVFLELFDYTCASCRDMSGDLETILAKFPGRIAVVSLPSPLHRACNPHLPDGVHDHENACDFALLALAIWNAAPEHFAEFHHHLFANFGRITPAEARAFADGLAGAEAMEAAVTSPEPAARLQKNLELYKLAARQSPVMPKVIFTSGRMLQGVARDVATLEQFLRKELQLGDQP